MPLRYRALASYGMKTMERRFRTRALRSPTLQYLRHSSSSSTSSNRLLHTTSSLHAPASALLQDDEDDEDLQKFAVSCMQEMVAKDTAFCSLDDELGEASVWGKPLEELFEPDPTQLQAEQKQLRDEQLVSHEVLSRFDPKNPPTTPEDLQLWLECEAQSEHVLKYQKVIDSAREREDYASLSVVQRQILEWYQPLKQGIEQEQQKFISGTDKRLGMNKYGPHLCSLPAEKLAVIVAQETIMHCLMHTRRGHQDKNGATLNSVARRIGEVVEVELNVHRVLEKRMQQKQAAIKEDEFGDALADFVSEEYNSLSDDIASTETTKEEETTGPTNWKYSAHHLQRFTEEISRNQNKSGKIRVKHANRRARELLESEEEWTVADHIKVGVALLEVLLNEATVKGSDGNRDKAFTYHKMWENEKLVGWVVLHDDIYKMIAEDPYGSTTALTSCHKPMVVPPNPWVGPRDGAYKWLKVEMMRTHGSKIQRVSCSKTKLR